MKPSFIVCLLALAAATQLPVHGANLGPVPLVQDTSRLGSARDARLAATRPQALTDQFRAEIEAIIRADSSAVAARPEELATPAPDGVALASSSRAPAAPLGRRVYRTRLLRTGHFGTRREAVEILTCTYAGPLVLAQLPATAAAPAQLLAGPGYDPAVALRPLPLTQEAVLRLCGDRAPQVLAYARRYDLHFQQAEEVARMLDFYNRIATIKWRMGE